MKLRNALLAASVLAAPVAALAQPVTGPYVAGGVGANYKQDWDISSESGDVGPYAGSSFGGNGKVRTEVGFVGLGSVGYGLGNGLRFEVEGNYRENNVRRITGTPFPTSSGGKIETYGVMVNALYDIDVSPYTGIQGVYPYVGVGAGYGWNYLQNVHQYATNFRGFAARTDQTDSNFAYQGIAGVAFPIDAVPGLSLTAEYRFYGVLGDTTYRGAADTGTPQALVGRTFGSLKLQDQYNHAGLVGFRYELFPPAPPPAPAQPVIPVVQEKSRSYLVFFDWDKATLTARARQIIHEAADASTHVQYTRIEVNGYTDTSGTPKYNQGLSVRRADAVAGELVRDGVPKQAISIQGFGETHLLVPTADGVREPQNRRVEIIIR